MQERIAVVFDFDDTLGPDSTTGFLKHAGLKDVEGFWKDVGDGYTDIPCFSLIKQNGGIPIAVYDHDHTEKWGNAFQFVADGRVSNLHSANYRQGSDLVIFFNHGCTQSGRTNSRFSK